MCHLGAPKGSTHHLNIHKLQHRERTRALVRAWVRKGKGKALLVQAWTSPEGSRSLRLPDFKKIFIITTELNPISHLLALLEARPKVHIKLFRTLFTASRIKFEPVSMNKRQEFYDSLPFVCILTFLKTG